jgi:photosystem II stability/assembly factor-like uncharacterized protein
MRLYLATDHGVRVAEKDEIWRVVQGGLDGQRATSISARQGIILAGTTDGIFRSEDEGKTWHSANQGLQVRHIRWLTLHPEHADLALAGSEPASIFISQDGGRSWEALPEVAALRDLHHWSLPYSPEAGCVRGFALRGDRAYAAVEVGGVLVSDVNATQWKLARGSSGNPAMGNIPTGFIHPDVHSIAVHPTSADLVFAPTGGGFYRSRDGGGTWELLYECYCRAAWVNPLETEHMILGPADGVDRNGRIEETHDGGKSWSNPFHELDTPWRQHMVERFTQVEDQLFAVLSNGEVLETQVKMPRWGRILPEISDVNAVAGMSLP